MRRLVLVLFAAAGLGACATDVMSEKQCLAGDWYGAGFSDGSDGKRALAFEDRAIACQAHDIGADERAYSDGRRTGLDRLCTEPGGYEYGRKGLSYLGVCGRDREEGFLAGYISGQRIHVAEVERGAAEQAHDKALAAVENYRRDMRNARERLDDPEATEKQLKKARKRRDNARDRLPDARRDVDSTLYELGRADEAFEQTISSADAWAQSREFASILHGLREAHEFARAHPAIEFCTDDFDGYYARCEVLYGQRLTDSGTGAVCAVGPGEARFVRRTLPRERGARQSYEFFPRDPENGKRARRPVGGFDVIFAGNGDYEGLACVDAP